MPVALSQRPTSAAPTVDQSEADRQRHLRQQLADRLAELELPDCDCPFTRIPCDCPEYRKTGDCRHPPRYPPPCAHVLAHRHAVTLEIWTQMLRADAPDDYADRPVSARPSKALTRKARVNLYRRRQKYGFAFFHPDDLYRSEDRRVTHQTTHGRNGRDDAEETLTLDYAEA